MTQQQSEKLGRALDELIEELDTAPLVSPANTQERTTSQGIPEGMAVVYKDVSSGKFVIQIGNLKEFINIKDQSFFRVRMAPDMNRLAFVRQLTTTFGNYRFYANLVLGRGEPFGELKGALTPVFSPDAGSIAYQCIDVSGNEKGIFVTNSGGRDVRKVANYSYPYPYSQLHDWKGDTLLVTGPYSDYKLMLVDAKTAQITEVTLPASRAPPPDTNFGMQLSLGADKIVYITAGTGSLMEYDIANDRVTEALAGNNYAQRVSKLYTQGRLRLSDAGTFLGYSSDSQTIEVLNLKTGDVWHLPEATVPFDMQVKVSSQR